MSIPRRVTLVTPFASMTVADVEAKTSKSLNLRNRQGAMAIALSSSLRERNYLALSF